MRKIAILLLVAGCSGGASSLSDAPGAPAEQVERGGSARLARPPSADEQEWRTVVDGHAIAAAAMADGGIALLGGSSEAIVSRIDREGRVLWSRSLAGEPRAIAAAGEDIAIATSAGVARLDGRGSTRYELPLGRARAIAVSRSAVVALLEPARYVHIDEAKIIRDMPLPRLPRAALARRSAQPPGPAAYGRASGSDLSAGDSLSS
jgi:hypothetical protein